MEHGGDDNEEGKPDELKDETSNDHTVADFVKDGKGAGTHPSSHQLERN